ncbi:ArsR/SmtB family transcription factor [Inhella proteolytica]|uniref:Winged helix-turn-helix transcriptional regulator n=1 Tax=Inhella proteolytica TaxID=2795029 RepID=A0A931J5J0_9BURK|nr:metalloregulator ArsR/SmtB family transcription factor [Inhella proteolytica]MBH9576727.1 winged helix-turn-helix transcriptional regulator [Inhella proteolytica]
MAKACAPASCAPSRAATDLDEAELASLCKALAHPARVQLLRHLAHIDSCYFGNLSDLTGLAPSTTSQHVKVLKEAGLIVGSSEEQRTCYCVNPERLALLKRWVQAL